MEERRADERRRIYDRRRAIIVTPIVERRRSDRRMLLAGAGMVAAVAMGGPRVVDYLQDRAPQSDVEVSTGNFRFPQYDQAALDLVIEEAARVHGVGADLVRAVVQTESAFNPFAVSPVGAQGLMQLMPVTANSLGVNDPFDPRQNVFGGVKYLSMLIDRFNGNVALALAGYNAGPSAVDRHRGIPPFTETRGYVQKIRQLVADTTSAFTMPATRPKRPSARGQRRAKTSLASARAQSRGSQVRPARQTQSLRARATQRTLHARTALKQAKAQPRASLRQGGGRNYKVLRAKTSGRRLRDRTRV